MALWHVLVEGTSEDSVGDEFDAVVLAHSERSARQLATRAVARESGPARSTEATKLSIALGVAFLRERGIGGQVIVRKEAVDG